jgi:hypothetical protein
MPASLHSSGAQKTACGCCGHIQMGWYDRKVRRVRDLSCGDTRIFLEVEGAAGRVPPLWQGEAERLDFLADNRKSKPYFAAGWKP